MSLAVEPAPAGTPPDGFSDDRGRGGLPFSLGALVTIALASTSILTLLLDLYGVSTMAAFGRFVALPSMLGLAAIGAAPVRGWEELRRRIRVGTVGGIVGTIGYDVVRVPIALSGTKLFAPIDSYGLLITNAHMSSPWTDTVGWLFHLSNGVTFGIMFAVVAARRHWLWGVAWGMTLETAVLVTPFRERYALSGQLAVIAISYAGHFAYGVPLGRYVQRLDHTDQEVRSVPLATPAALVAAVFAIVLWHAPWHEGTLRSEAGRVASQAGTPAIVIDQPSRFVPEWVRVDRGGCVQVANHRDASVTTKAGTVAPHATATWCFPKSGITRLKVAGDAFSGAFVFVDD